MSETHEYPTWTLTAEELLEEHVLVGASGGLSAVYAVTQFNGDIYFITTEHGTLIATKQAHFDVFADQGDRHGS
jgi:hypothetical protein